MKLCPTIAAVVLIGATVASAQIPVYKSNEEYCAANPNAVGCRDGRPVDVMKEMQDNWGKINSAGWCAQPNRPGCPDSAASSVPPRPAAITRASVPATSDAPILAPRRAPRTAEVRTGDLDWRLIPPQSDLLVGINVRDLVASDLARSVLTEWLTKAGASTDEIAKAFANLSGISQMVVSMRQNQVLAVLVGDVDRFPEGAQAGGLQSMRVSADTIVFGSNQALWGVNHRLRFGAIPSTAAGEGRQLASTGQLWLWGRPSAFAAFGQPALASAPITKIRFGASVRHGFRMDIIVDTANAETANRMVARSRRADQMQAAVEGNAVHYTMALDDAAARHQLAAFMPGPAGAQLQALLAMSRQMSAQKTAHDAPSSGRIVIQGLDEGPREIPLHTAP